MPEFVTGEELIKKVQAGRQQLQRAFNTKVQLFVPPHVRLSNYGVRAVSADSLNIVRGYGPRPREVQPALKWWTGYAKILNFYFRHRKKLRYPKPIDYGTHRELYSHRLNHRTDISWCKRALDYIAARDGVFCLSIHANGLTDAGKRKLYEIVAYAKRRDTDFVTASEALEADQGGKSNQK
jgi:hypothetical protein